MQQITIEMIENKEFKRSPRGYDAQEVDEFLDAICDEMARQMDEMAALKQQLAAKPQPARVDAATTQVKPVAAKPVYAAPAADSSKDALEVLAMAQKVKSETIAEAERKAAEIVAKAQADADAQLSSITAEKENLTSQVAALKQAAADYRAQFEALLQAQQEALDKASGLF